MRELDRLAHRLDDALRDVHRDRCVTDVFEQQHELVAAEARDGVVGANVFTQPCGDLGEHGIAGLVPEHVVDELEAVEVAIQHGVLLARPRAAEHAVVEPVDEHLSPGEPGQAVEVEQGRRRRDLRPALDLGDPGAQLVVLAEQCLDRRRGSAARLGLRVHAQFLPIRAPTRHRTLSPPPEPRPDTPSTTRAESPAPHRE